MITKDNLSRHELIGLRVTIQEASSPTMKNICGTIIYETKKMLVVKNENGIKAIPKMAAHKVRVELPSDVCFISGSSLIARPEDRILRTS